MPEAKIKLKNEDRTMRYEINPINLGTVFFGVSVIFIGLYYLARNLDLVPQDLQISLWQLWPVLIIIAGLSFLKLRSWITIFLGIVTVVALIGLIGAFIIWGQYNANWDVEESPIDISLEADAKKGQLDLDFGAGNIKIKGGSDEFAVGSLKSNILALQPESNLSEDVQRVKLNFDSRKILYTGRHQNDLNLSLNNNIPMALYIDSGAANMDFDLSNVFAEIVDINTGASDLDLTMGDKIKHAKLNIDAGASSVDISVPRTVGVDLNIDAGVTSKQIDNFEEVQDNTYRSWDYQNMEKFLSIDLDLGVSDLKINWK